MKKTVATLFALVFSVHLLIAGDPMARLQVIHNAADPAATEVDVYVNGGLLLDDFAFRTATPYVDVPAGVTLEIGVAPGTSSSADDIIATFPVVLDDGGTYVAIANGVLDPSAFAANPDGRSTAFTLFLKDMARENGKKKKYVDFFAVHGSTDAPTVDIIARDVATLVDNAAYGDITGYLQVRPKPYVLDITPGDDNSVIVVSFDVDLTGLGGGAAVVFASGFLSPDDNQNGAGFGIFAALSDGTVAEFPVHVPTARLQVIHNAADPAATEVDVYVNGGLLLDDFAFRTATPYVDVPAGVTLEIGVAPGTSSSADDIIATFPVVLDDGGTYVAIANGVLDPSAFAANPDGRSTAFTLFLKDMARENGKKKKYVDFFAVHGSTDAPTVDIIARDVATLVDNAAYGDITGYLQVRPKPYVLDITPGDDNSVIVVSFDVDLTGLGGGAAVVFASGFLSPDDNQNGAGFGIFAALSDGTVAEFPVHVPTARLQVIHNAADPAATEVDVYVNGGLLLDDFAFRTATPYVDVPADVTLDIGVAPGTSDSADDIIATFPVKLRDGGTYLAMASGVLDPSAFAPNPDGRSTGFTLYLKENTREKGRNSKKFDFIAFHGATDAPVVDIIARDAGKLVNDAGYGDITNYKSCKINNYIIDVTPGADNKTIVASFQADLTGLGGAALVIFASGFLSPDDNQNGEAFGLFAALSDGIVVELPAFSGSALNPSVEENIGEVALNGVVTDFKLQQNYPNPFNPSTRINFALPESNFVTLKVYDSAGREVSTLVSSNMPAGNHQVTFDARNYASGIYFYRIQAGNFSAIKSMLLVK